MQAQQFLPLKTLDRHLRGVCQCLDFLTSCNTDLLLYEMFTFWQSFSLWFLRHIAESAWLLHCVQDSYSRNTKQFLCNGVDDVLWLFKVMWSESSPTIKIFSLSATRQSLIPCVALSAMLLFSALNWLFTQSSKCLNNLHITCYFFVS